MKKKEKEKTKYSPDFFFEYLPGYNCSQLPPQSESGQVSLGGVVADVQGENLKSAIGCVNLGRSYLQSRMARAAPVCIHFGLLL